MKIVTQRLNALSRKSPVSINKQAREMGVSPSTWKHLLQGRSVPNGLTLVAICKHFGASADWILGLKGKQE